MSSPISYNSTILRRDFRKGITEQNRVELMEARPVIAKVSFVGAGYCLGTRDDEGEVKVFATLGEAFDYFDETVDCESGYIADYYGLGTFTSITMENGRFYLRTGGKVRGGKKNKAISWVMCRQRGHLEAELDGKFGHINLDGLWGHHDNFTWEDTATQKFYGRAEKMVDFAPRTQQTKEERLRSLGHEDKAEIEHLRKLAKFQADLLQELDPVPEGERYEEFFGAELPANITFEEVMGNQHAEELARELC